MTLRHSLLAFSALALPACGDSRREADAAVPDSTAAAAVPAPPATLGADTMVTAGAWRCADGGEWSVSVWVGPGARVVLSSDREAPMVLPQRVAASGVRYADSAGTVSWWNKGDSATFERKGRRTSCGAAPDVIF